MITTLNMHAQLLRERLFTILEQTSGQLTIFTVVLLTLLFVPCHRERVSATTAIRELLRESVQVSVFCFVAGFFEL